MRPGAYDITSSNYREMKNISFEKSINTKKHKFKLNIKEKNKINILLSKEKIDLDHKTLINYIRFCRIILPIFLFDYYYFS